MAFPIPRPKRQRPSWLPAWIPFKDGRYLGLARQTILAWSSTIIALVFSSLTISYARGSSCLTRARFVYSSQSSTILILRVFSEAAGVFLVATIHAAFEIVQWVLISRPEGIRLPQFLALQPSTGPLGLLVLATGKGLPASQWPMSPRILSTLRLAAELVVPVLGVLIMSRVSTDTIYAPNRATIQPMAFGMEPFNSTIASQLGVMGDMFFNLGYVSFLSDPLHAIDITPSSAAPLGCAKGMSLTPFQTCLHRILIAQELQNVNANLQLTGDSLSKVVLTSNQQVFSLEFHDNIEASTRGLQCKDFVSGPAMYTLCLSSSDDGAINASIVPCPANLVVNGRCTLDTAWRSSRGFSTSLSVSFVRATVAYQRMDGRILWYKAQPELRPAIINPGQLLNALSIILATNTTSWDNSFSNPVLGAPTHFFGRLVAAHTYRISRLNMTTNLEAHLKGTNALQNLLAITLFYCQNGILSQTVLPSLSTSATNVTNPYSQGAFEQPEKSALVAFADVRYKLKVSRTTLIAYTVISGLTLLICITALVIGSLMELALFDAEPTLWPSLDFFTQCRVEDDSNKVVPAHKRIELAWIYDGRQMFREIEGLRVKRRKRQPRPLELETQRTDDG